jgi:methionyl-tRNA formyltransferase
LPQSVFLEPGVIPKPAPRIFPADTVIRWDSEPADIHNFIRGLSPQPGARSSFRRGKDIISFKIQESLPEVASHGLRPGYIVSDGKRFLKVACNKGFISIASIQPEGKKRMSIPEFLRGFDINGITVPFS